MSKYTLKFYKGRTLIAESGFDSLDFDDGDGEMTPTMASQIAGHAAQMIEEAIDCNQEDEKS